MSPDALYEANHGTWHLSDRVGQQRYALFTFEGIGVQAIEIDRVERVAETIPGKERSRRSVIRGTILQPGHPVSDAYVDQPSPVPRAATPFVTGTTRTDARAL